MVFGLFSVALAFQHAEQIAAALVTSGLVVLMMSPWMPARTKRGAKARLELRGLRNHLELPVERTDRDAFESLLPFAMVLGAADPWIGGFRGSFLRLEWFELAPNQARPPRFSDALRRFAREVSLHIRTRPASVDPRDERENPELKHGGNW